MAIGDDAAAAGMAIVNGATTQAKDIDTEINRTRDYVAQRTSAVTPVNRGGTGAQNAATARTNLGAAPTSHTHHIFDILTADGSRLYSEALQEQINALSQRISNLGG